MEKAFYSIKEFAEAANVSEQSVYKRLKKDNDPIHQFISYEDGKKVIAAAALQIIYNRTEPLRPKQKEKAAAEPQQEMIDFLKLQLENMQHELEEKNKTIADLLEQAKESSKRETQYQQLLDQQQKLTAIDKQKILALESAAENKKGLFRFFGKKKKETEGAAENE